MSVMSSTPYVVDLSARCWQMLFSIIFNSGILSRTFVRDYIKFQEAGKNGNHI
ncbi:hypothetical protein CBFG_00555 [Clostridiales bacterium 1_7_47FAA]|nr:hypothetical protein CBFG_00555 [Clostridiales bacterium 1_7_47FAA]